MDQIHVLIGQTAGAGPEAHDGGQMAEHELSHHTDAHVERRSHGDVAPALISKLQGAAGGQQLDHATGPAGTPGDSERPSRTGLSRSPPGGLPAIGVVRAATFRDAERAHLVVTCCRT